MKKRVIFFCTFQLLNYEKSITSFWKLLFNAKPNKYTTSINVNDNDDVKC